MALSKFSQKAQDPVLVKAAPAEHGFSTFAHLNVLVAALNEQFSDFEASVGSTDTSLLLTRDYADNAEAIAEGLDVGDLYHTAGVLKIVI